MHGVVTPVWVPPAVTIMADVLPVADGEIGRQLRTDARMKSIWRGLQRAPLVVRRGEQRVPLSLDGLESWQRLATYGVQMKEWRRRPDGTEGLCPRFPLRDEACAAFFVSAVVELGFYRPVWTRAEMHDRAKKALNDRKADRQEAMNLTGWAKRSGPYVLKRRSEYDDTVRGRARALAVETKKIFGQFRYHTVAVTTNVALNTTLTWPTVQDWCADLP